MPARVIWGQLPIVLLLGFAWWQGILLSQTKPGGAAGLRTGREIFRAACAGCHGPDGKGMPQSTIGFEPPATFPDFTDCNATARETDVLWRSIIHYGGPARGFSEIMPSFTEALSGEQIVGSERVPARLLQGAGVAARRIEHAARAHHREGVSRRRGVDGDLRSTRQATPAVASKLIYERRFGRANQIEMNLPFGFRQDVSGGRGSAGWGI